MAFIICDNCISIVSTAEPCPCGKSMCGHQTSGLTKRPKRIAPIAARLTLALLTFVTLVILLVQY